MSQSYFHMFQYVYLKFYKNILKTLANSIKITNVKPTTVKKFEKF